MKAAVRKSAIPGSKSFLLKELIAPYFDRSWHFHQEYQIFLVQEGRGTRFVGDSIRTFREGDLVFLGPNLPHLWRSDNEYLHKNSLLQTRGIVIYFQEDFLGGSISKKEELESLDHLFKRAKQGLEVHGYTKSMVSHMMVELLHLTGVESIIQLLRIMNTLALSDECTEIAHVGYINPSTEADTDRIGRVYEHIMLHFKNKISLEEVAAIANLSQSSFNRYFKSRANKSFSDFLSEVRIGHACKLLHEQDLTISQVCYESGFNTLSNFNKQFKDLTGITPLQYKKEHQKHL
ncbi:AraC family transcriptional regulator [Pontibacter diazotrophicus]|uniref:AraC family transcriptional regulator n=1 Tax=Pontibacter diazotrophicus TaxID=1400979 RepID=A0A3D8L6M7_9BACT|nr:AraC family transcriptional regulator [Pontibacter diazotrophicus]RDV13049.1 AraC family transcriptional regulator [Pontibacter diazotrophicus]